MSAHKAQLRQQLTRLIKQTNWAADKQAIYLNKIGLDNWNQCDESQLQSTIDYLEQFTQMFSKTLDSGAVRHDNRDEVEALRVYLGEGEEQ